MKQDCTCERVVVVGGGHAGVEAAHACARMGVPALLVTHQRCRIGEMSCNPAIGGIGKGHLVAEVDALDGLMGRAADAAGIQFRLLNRSKGPAVRGPRAQCDRELYRKAVQSALGATELVEILEAEVIDLLLSGGEVRGVVLTGGQRVQARAVVLTTGTFLGGRLFRGESVEEGGRAGDSASVRLAERIREVGLPIGRLKTGTPPRIWASSIRLGTLQPQRGDAKPTFFSSMTAATPVAQIHCHVTRTTPRTHEIIAKNLHRSAVYSGAIGGMGPRYCPSIEDKVARFPERDSHQIFLEPEGLKSPLVYPNGISTSLPAEIQEDVVRSIPGLEAARIVQHGYAVEYDFVDPQCLSATLECRALPRLYLAGQINGTTGYEEAAAQGLIAGLNAASVVLGRPTAIFDRADGYLGVLVDDLITQGVREPYRMFTSRAEFRLHLRVDNADRRLTLRGIEIGCVGAERQKHFEDRMEQFERTRSELEKLTITSAHAEAAGLAMARDGAARSALDLLARPDVHASVIRRIWPQLDSVDLRVLDSLANDARYAPYAERQARDIAVMRRDQAVQIPTTLDYRSISGLSTELSGKLSAARPADLAQAARIDGMTPAALTLLLAHSRRVPRDAA